MTDPVISAQRLTSLLKTATYPGNMRKQLCTLIYGIMVCIRTHDVWKPGIPALVWFHCLIRWRHFVFDSLVLFVRWNDEDDDIIFSLLILCFHNPLQSPHLPHQCGVAQNAWCHAVGCLISYQPCEVVKAILRIWCFLWTCLAVFKSFFLAMLFCLFFIWRPRSLLTSSDISFPCPWWCYCINLRSLKTEYVPMLLWCQNSLC